MTTEDLHTAMLEEQALPIGTSLSAGQFTITSQIGAGGFGIALGVLVGIVVAAPFVALLPGFVGWPLATLRMALRMAPGRPPDSPPDSPPDGPWPPSG